MWLGRYVCELVILYAIKSLLEDAEGESIGRYTYMLQMIIYM